MGGACVAKHVVSVQPASRDHMEQQEAKGKDVHLEWEHPSQQSTGCARKGGGGGAHLLIIDSLLPEALGSHVFFCSLGAPQA